MCLGRFKGILHVLFVFDLVKDRGFSASLQTTLTVLEAPLAAEARLVQPYLNLTSQSVILRHELDGRITNLTNGMSAV